MNPPTPLAIIAYLRNRYYSADYLVDMNNRVLRLIEWQEFSYGDTRWVAASAEDEKTGKAFCVHPNFIKLLIRKK